MWHCCTPSILFPKHTKKNNDFKKYRFVAGVSLVLTVCKHRCRVLVKRTNRPNRQTYIRITMNKYISLDLVVSVSSITEL